MNDYISIGATPCDEPCAQVGSADYATNARKECRAFADQLRRVLGEPPLGARIGIKGFDHDFGTYYEVVVYYDDTYPDSEEWAFKAEGNAPSAWDEQARKELGLITA